jgi:hypothetical protein
MLATVTGQHRMPDLDSFLVSIPVFSSLEEMTRRRLAEHLESVHVAAGDVAEDQRILPALDH